jgi:dynamin-binding protein
MMQKRKKRLVDHIRYKSVVQRGEKPDKKLQLEEDQYNAVNETLKDELPKLYALTKKLVEACLTNFIDIQAHWQSIVKRKIEPFVDNAPHMPSDLTQYINVLQSTFNQDLAEWEARVQSLGICNGATLMEAQNFLSPTTTFTQEDTSSSHKRPSTVSSGRRTLSMSSEQATHSTPNFGRISDNFAAATAFSPSPLLGSFPMPDGISQSSTVVRTRAGSALSSRGPSTPHSMNAQPAPAPSNYYAGRPSMGSERTYYDAPTAVPRLDLDIASGQGFGHDENFFPPDTYHHQADPNTSVSHISPDERFSGIFHSALPMSDSPRSSSPQLAEGEAKVLFLAASLFEFNIDGSRREAGYPYLRYVPGEVRAHRKDSA